MSADFSDVPLSDVLDFAAVHPLAWIVPAAAPSTAMLMPLLIETDGEGSVRTRSLAPAGGGN